MCLIQGSVPGALQRRHCLIGAGWHWPLLAGLWLLLAVGVERPGRAETFSELEVRAVYLYNFAAFVDWPESAFESPTSPLRYCVLSNRGLLDKLEHVLGDESLDGRPFELVADEAPERWSRCHLLYVDHTFPSLIWKARRVVGERPVLTVGDSDAFVHQGGMIALVRRGGRLRTFICRDAAAEVGIRVSSKLLRIAILAPAGCATNVR